MTRDPLLTIIGPGRPRPYRPGLSELERERILRIAAGIAAADIEARQYATGVIVNHDPGDEDPHDEIRSRR